jgi:hypothetical protein
MQRSNRLILFAVALLVALPGAVWAETWTNVSLVDVNCSTKVASDPDSHPRSCALKCASSGYGVFTADGKYVKLDADGSKKALELLKASSQTDHLRVNVTGEMVDGALKVSSIEMAPAS